MCQNNIGVSSYYSVQHQSIAQRSAAFVLYFTPRKCSVAGKTRAVAAAGLAADRISAFGRGVARARSSLDGGAGAPLKCRWAQGMSDQRVDR